MVLALSPCFDHGSSDDPKHNCTSDPTTSDDDNSNYQLFGNWESDSFVSLDLCCPRSFLSMIHHDLILENSERNPKLTAAV